MGAEAMSAPNQTCDLFNLGFELGVENEREAIARIINGEDLPPELDVRAFHAIVIRRIEARVKGLEGAT